MLIRNHGSSIRGAFDIAVHDTPASGLVVPTSGLNLCITRGDGSIVSYTNMSGAAASPTDLFGSGILLSNQSATT